MKGKKIGLITILTALIFCSSLLAACHSKKHVVVSTATDSKDFAESLSTLYTPIDTDNHTRPKTISENMYLAYQDNEYAPIWLSGGKPSDNAKKLVDELDGIRYDGIDPERYHVASLKNMLAGFHKTNDVNNLIAFDTVFTLAYLAAAHDLLMGLIHPNSADTVWYHPNDSTWNAPEMIAAKSNGFPSLDAYRSQVPAYKLLRNEYELVYKLRTDSALLAAITGAAAKNKESIDYVAKTEMPWISNEEGSSPNALLSAYQYYNDIQATGRVDSFTTAVLTRSPDQILQVLARNMERMRWMPRETGSLYIVVNVPLAELFFIKDDNQVMHMRTVVGKPERQTPSIGASMANVVLNPPWGVPPTILKKDVLPGMDKSGVSYLNKKGLKVYDQKGNQVDPSRVNDQNYKHFTFKQDPGDDNSLGYVKFNLPNKWDIYLHDTPHRGDFPRRNRTLSSGCVRLEKPQEMALYILSELENKRYDQERLDSVIQTHKTRWEILKTKIPVHIVYLTAYEDSTATHLRFARDVYHRDALLDEMLQKAN
ncbi:MAG: L,D-transpeptidase family protein [Taibaiella sp.]|nr:L,D-transpeptidase family protein [Taibaiella sp.]